MKKFLQRVVLVAVAMATAQVAVAESWRINNDTSKGAHFVDINAAMASEQVKDGDVLYLDPGCVLSNVQNISKAVTVIGTGWLFTGRPYQAAVLEKDLNIVAAAIVSGLQIKGTIYPGHNDIVIERCLIGTDIIHTSTSFTTQNLLIRQCSINGYIRGCGKTSLYSFGWKIYNCIVQNDGSSFGTIHGLYGVEIVNNLLHRDYKAWDVLRDIEDAIVKNNIIINTAAFANGTYKDYIIAAADNLQVYNNVISADSTTWANYSKYPDNVCVGSQTLTDYLVNTGLGGSWAQLCEGSPAIGAGEGGIDCGPYAKGSLYPFVTYGMPKHIPYFTEAVVPAQPTDGKVKVSLKIVNQND